jgi:hypothetical protein
MGEWVGSGVCKWERWMSLWCVKRRISVSVGMG